MSGYTPIDQIAPIVNNVRKSFQQGISKDISFRKKQLEQLSKCVTENEARWKEALFKDLNMVKIFQENEISVTKTECRDAIENLDEWTKPEKKSVPLLQFPGSAAVYREPYGVVLIVAPFNYPLSLITRPLVGAIAAGNCCIIKPSEVSVHTQNLVVELFPKYLDPRCFQVITGGIAESTELLKQRYDYILYTGNGTVGKIVMKAAAEYLTPVSLELGGKSPLIITDDVNIKSAIKRISFGKWLNVGQTCIAPDYIMVPKSKQADLVEELRKTIKDFFGEDPKISPDYGRIINERHTKRIGELLSGGKVVIGGEVDVANRYVAPTVLTDVDVKSPLMTEEIFGPVLPIINYNTVDEAIEFINDRPKPLALYVFSNDKKKQEQILTSTSFGGCTVNDTLMHNACSELPFGGVGPSGMGSYNGKYGFELFTHQKAILKKSLASDPGFRFPPYTDSSMKTLKRIQSIRLPKIKPVYVVVLLALVVGYLWPTIRKEFNL